LTTIKTAHLLAAKKEAWQSVVARQEGAVALIATLENGKSIISVYDDASKLNANQLKLLVSEVEECQEQESSDSQGRTHHGLE
jgi:hypothetical protein